MKLFDLHAESILGYIILVSLLLFFGIRIVKNKKVALARKSFYTWELKGESAVRVGYFLIIVGVGFLIQLLLRILK